jgi:hypothetical protein
MTLKREDLSSLPEIIKTYCFYLFYLLRHVASRSTMLDYFQQRLICISEEQHVPRRQGNAPISV